MSSILQDAFPRLEPISSRATEMPTTSEGIATFDHVPAWFSEEAERIRSFKALPLNWDLEHANRVPNNVAVGAVEALFEIAPMLQSRPEVSPLNDGAILLEWQRSTMNELELTVQVEITPLGAFEFNINRGGAPIFEATVASNDILRRNNVLRYVAGSESLLQV